MFCHTFWSQSVMDQTISRLRAQDLPFAMAQGSESRESGPLLSLWRLSKGQTLYSTLHVPIPSRSSPSPGGCIGYHWGTGPHHLTLHMAMAGTQLEHTFQARKATRQGCWHILWTPPPVWQVRSTEQCPNLKQEISPGWRKTPAEEEQSQEMLSLWWQTAAWQLPEQLFGTSEWVHLL